MIESLSTVAEETGTEPGSEVTVRCRIRSNPMPGETGGQKTVYLVEDPYEDLDTEVALSFWVVEPDHHEGLRRASTYVRSSLGVPSPTELNQEEYSVDRTSLQRGEEVLARVVPNRSEEGGTLFLNVTSFVIRAPDQLISKSKLRTQERCPREYYLRYVKRVYPGDKFGKPPYEQANRFRGDAIHKIAENALIEHRDRFRDRAWEPELVESFCEEQFESEFGFRQALLVLSGAGLDVREHVIDAVTRLFTDENFLNRIAAADEIEAERYLSGDYGYAGRVDILLDGVPYDIKTTRNVDTDTVATHSHQIKLYLFALLIERLDRGASFEYAIEAGQTGYLVYPNTADRDDVRFEPVELTQSDVQEFLNLRNEVVKTGDAFAPPSTYNRDCDGCAFAVEEWITGKDDALPPACTYHCQNERRWPCYETDGGELTTDCSLFDRCDQRTQYRDPDVIAHYEATRAAFHSERTARKAAARVMSAFDSDLLTEAGYQIPNLKFSGASGAGAVLRFSTSDPVVPVFEPGDIVTIRPQSSMDGTRAVYYGKTDGEFLFRPVDERLNVGRFLGNDTQYEAVYTFDVDSIEDRYLPYLDFAQRRNEGEPIDGTTGAGSTQSVTEVVDPSNVINFLDRKHVFVDLPVSQSRNELLGELVQHLVTAAYPSPDGNTVPESARRALVLGTRPNHVEVAVNAQPDGEHYRLDGTGGSRTIQNEDGYHEIQSRLLDSRSVVSTVQQATSKNGPGGMREFFHRLMEGEFGDRAHSESFFDVLVVLGAQQLTEPEYHFLSDVADRVVAIGDTRLAGPQMLSTTANNTGLDAFFKQELERYRSFPSGDAVSLQIAGEAPPALGKFYGDGPWERIEGDLTFLNIEGDEETAVDTIEFEVSVPAANGTGRRLVFDVTDTPLSPMKAHELFEDRIELDATALRADSIVVLDDQSLYLQSKDSLDGEESNHHQIIIRAVASELPQFSRALLSNRIAEQIVAEVAATQTPDIVVTPFERHATRIKRLFNEEGIDIPVQRPEELDGTITEHAILSFATSNPEGIVRPPLDDPTVLYPMFASARNLTLIGSESTLESKDIFETLIDSAAAYSS